jgi:PadR family transcriptional regulator, regulatory protein PadR
VFRRQKKTDALQGTLDLLVLTTLRRGPAHGYAIASHIQTVSQELLRVEEGSLYPALHRMEQAGWVTAAWTQTESNRRVRTYRLTRSGTKRLEDDEAKWEQLTKGVSKVLRYVSS